MNFLLEEGFDLELINKMINNYDESIIDQFIIEKENVKDVINYFKKIGINNIDLLLQTRIEVFTKDINSVKDSFLKHNIKEKVAEINKDINSIDFV